MLMTCAYYHGSALREGVLGLPVHGRIRLQFQWLVEHLGEMTLWRNENVNIHLKLSNRKKSIYFIALDYTLKFEWIHNIIACWDKKAFYDQLQLSSTKGASQLVPQTELIFDNGSHIR